MKKTDVYVVVDTPKKAKKLKRLLEMFGENAHPDIERPFINNCLYFDSEGFYDTAMYKNGVYTKNKTEVSIKELRNILAKEHLKEGDVVIFKEQGDYSICEFERMAMKSFEGQFVSKKYCNLYGSELELNGGIHENFIRYATEEEKALLEPNKELKVGKWYKTKRALFNHQNGYDSYGFFDNKWVPDNWKTNLYDFAFVTPIEATSQEVEQSLIEEAKRRGFVNGSIGNNSNIHNKNLKDCELFFNNEYEFDNKDNLLRVILDEDTTWTVFEDGQWASIIEQEKFAELKEAHRNGAVIQLNSIYNGWHDVEDDSDLWLPTYEYRIKPKTTFTDEDVAIIERLHDTLLDNHKYDLQSDLLIDARILAEKIKSNIK